MPQNQKSHSLFVYGSLQIPSIAEIVGGGPFISEPCVLPGYRRRRIQDRPWPGIRPDSGERTSGLLLRDVSATQIDVFDLFEGDTYERRTVRVRLLDSAEEELNAFAYVVQDHLSGCLSDEIWDPKWFKKNFLEDFTERCRIFRSEIDRVI
ncbi:gamma-glutamylcyclotransferase [Myxococcota bacterium]|nr:gamma-glutamylcyclotransferase [Myxococcota bacterium]